MANHSRLVILSGPSGSGKSSVVKRLLETCDLPLRLSVSATTRGARPGEQSGVHYQFLSQEQFDELRQRGEFLECIEVYPGTWYGTPQQAVQQALGDGIWVILEIDVRGAKAVVDKMPDSTTIFVDPGSLEELERRLRGRGTETEEKIQKRLAVARTELDNAAWYQHRVINANVDQTAQQICQILKSIGG